MKKISAFLIVLTLGLQIFAGMTVTVSADSALCSASGDGVLKYLVVATGETKETKTLYGRTCGYAERAGTNIPRFDTSNINDGVVEGAYYVLETAVALGEDVKNIWFTTRNYSIFTDSRIKPSELIEGQWNDIKITWQNTVGAAAKVYINGKYCKETTVKSVLGTTNTIRMLFESASDANTSGYVNYFYLNKVDSPDTRTYLFTKDMILYPNTGWSVMADTMTANNGIYGRTAQDGSFYFERTNNNPRVNAVMSSTLDTTKDLVIETSIVPGSGDISFSYVNNDFYVLKKNILKEAQWNKVKMVVDFTDNTADLYINGVKNEVNLKNSLKDYTGKEIRMVVTGGIQINESDKLYYMDIDYFHIYQVDHGTETGVETAGLTASNTVADGYAVDFTENTICAKNVSSMTADTLKTALGIDNNVFVRAYSDEKCETQVTGNLSDGNKISIATDGGIIQVFTINEDTEVLSIDENGTATFSQSGEMSGVLIVAAYNADNNLIAVNIKPVTEGTTLASSTQGADHYKAFLFDSIVTAVPLAKSVSSK